MSYRDYSLACCNTLPSSNCCTPGVRAARGRSSPYTRSRVSWWHQSLCDATALLPQVFCCWDQPLPELGFLCPHHHCGCAMLAVPELPQPGKPKAEKVGERKGLTTPATPFGFSVGSMVQFCPGCPVPACIVPVPGGSGMKQNHFHTKEQDRESWRGTTGWSHSAAPKGAWSRPCPGLTLLAL